MYLLGAGLGLQMQVLVTVVQNTVDRRHMGTATSSVTFFRQLGGTFGTAVFGAIITSRVAVHLAGLLPGATAPDVDDIAAIKALPPPLHEPVVEAFTLSMHEAFLAGVPLLAVAFTLAWFIKEKPLTARTAPARPEARTRT
jgi:hypothetical protein